MPSSFPDKPDYFSTKINNVDTIKAEDINNLQDSVVRIENSLATLVEGDTNLLSLCHYEQSASGYRNLNAIESGPVRYSDGKYGKGVFIERGTQNFVKNPAIRTSDSLWSFTTTAGSLSCERVTSEYPSGIQTNSSLQIKVTSSGDAEAQLKTDLDGLASNATYLISFYIKNLVSGNNFSGIEMKIVRNDGSGLTGQAFTITNQWTRVTGVYTTDSNQDTFNLVVKFGKSGALLNDSIFISGFQVEEGNNVSGYCDGNQGKGFIWTGEANASASIRSNTVVSYAVSSDSEKWLNSNEGSIGFWIKPGWNNSDNTLRTLFDTSVTAVGKQITIFKDTDNKLNFKILEPGGQYIQVRTDNTPDWEPAGGWKLIVCVYHYNTSTNIWTLKIFIDGLQQTITSTGSASTSNLPGSLMYIGASSIQTNFSNSIFDDFFIYDVELTDVEISQIFDSNIQMSEGILRATTGHSTTASTIGDETTVAHSLGEIPSFIEITEKGPGIVYLSGDSTNQYFYVKSTGSSINFNWRAWK